ncbi:MAG: GNAT family N-acetyltransferase [Alphaproteobacteria bacterium]
MLSDSPFHLRPTEAAPNALEGYSRLLSQVFGAGPRFTRAALAWRYGANPLGQVVGTDAFVGDDLAAHYATCPAPISVEGRRVKALLSLNTATHPDHQGRGLFTKLAEATFEAAGSAGYDLVFGVANANSTPGFIKRLGFQLVAPLAAGILCRLPSDLPGDAPQFQGAWEAESLAWRLANPATTYKARSRQATTQVLAPTHLPGLKCAAILPGTLETGKMTAPTLPLPRLYLGLEPRMHLPSLGFIPIPQRLRPSPLNLIYKPLKSTVPQVLDPHQVAISFLDFDPY